MSISKKFWLATAGATSVATLLFIVGMLRNGTLDYWYLLYNLALAAIPLFLSLWILRLLKKYAWGDWRLVAPTVGWLLFLPNSFYIVTDFIHVADGPRVDIVQDVVMLMLFSVLGLMAGFISLSMLHRRWSRDIGDKRGMVIAIAVLFLSSLAIYLGRELRWNSWDIIINPLVVIRDTVLLWVNPEALWMIGSYFGMLVTLYLMWWYGRKLTI